LHALIFFGLLITKEYLMFITPTPRTPRISPHFGHITPPAISTYGKPADGNGSPHLRLYTIQPEGFPRPHTIAHRDKAPKGAVHALTVVPHPETKEDCILLIKQKRAAFGGLVTLETPAGLIGDEDPAETAKTAGPKEVREEMGYEAKASGSLAPNAFATSSGMTTEQKVFSWVKADSNPKETNLQGSEKVTILGPVYVPVTTFANYKKFQAWLTEQEKQGMLVGLDVIAARGLMPPLRHGKLNLVG
jgi:8-oxo-dGTP pyrophosphatase MutT (NUDIX family)